MICGGGCLSADVLYTTGLGTSGNDPVYSTSSHNLISDTTGGYELFADSFTVTQNSTATDVLVPLARFGSTYIGPTVDFYILADSGGAPDTDQFGNPNAPLYSGAATGITTTTPTVYTATLTGTATLTPGTTYWLEGKFPACPCTQYQADKWYANSSVNGFDVNSYSSGWSGNSGFTPAFTLEGTAAGSPAPEPGSAFLIGIALSGAALASRKLRRS